MASNPITATNLANWIPEIWSKQITVDVEKNLVLGGLVDRRYEEGVGTGGDTIVVPHLFEITANAVNTALDETLYDSIQNVTNIAIDQKYSTGVLVDDINKLQTNPKYHDRVREKLAYGLAKQIDINIGALIPAFSLQRNSAFQALIEDDLIGAYESLNENDVPYDDRAWVFDPESVTDLLKLDYFVKSDYVDDLPVVKGFQHRRIFGNPVYITTNLDTVNVNCHAACYMHREAIALVMQMQPKIEIARVPLRWGDVIHMLTVFGVKEMKDSFGYLIRTRS